MKKFKFRLERVLQYREILRKEALRELWTANAALAQAQSTLAELLKRERVNQMVAGAGQTAEYALLFGQFAERLKADIDATRSLIEIRKADADAALNQYIETAKDAKGLDTLKSRQRQAHQEFTLKEEEKVLDELAVQRYTRQ